MFSILFFSWSGDHRDLPSFPTRRSSDLRSARWELPAPPASRAFRSWRGSRAFRASPPASPASRASRRPASRRARSEEHTSELQSRRDLVCRLLLEKKKKKTIPCQERVNE